MKALTKYLTIAGMGLLATGAFGQNSLRKPGNLEEGIHSFTRWSDKNWNNKADKGEFDNFDREVYSESNLDNLKFYFYSNDIQYAAALQKAIFYIIDKESGEIVHSGYQNLFKGQVNLLYFNTDVIKLEKEKEYELKLADFRGKKNVGKEYTIDFMIQ